MNRELLRKIYATPIIVLIALSLLVVALPVLKTPMVYAARGGPKLAAADCYLPGLTCYNIIIANYNVSIRAGSINVSKLDGADAVGYFALVFGVDDTWHVQFDGAWFDLYISKDGYSALSPDDVKYAGPFRVVDLVGSPKNVTVVNPVLAGGRADFTIGKFTIGTTTYYLVIGPIPFDITADYKYIKVFDGVASQVAVTGEIIILGSLSIEPTFGPGGRTVTIRGVALLPNELVNLSYLPPAVTTETVFAQVRTDSVGRFVYTFSIIDLKKVWSGTGSIPWDLVTIRVKYNRTGEVIGDLTYREYRRAFVEIRSVAAGHSPLPFTNLYTGAGNETITVNVNVFDTVIVAGAWWNPTDTVRIYVNRTLVATATPNATHGFFNVTFTVPELPIGTHVVNVTQEGIRVWYVFWINVLPTLVLIPTSGPVGTVVEARAYGFPPNSLVGIWWHGCRDWTNVVNGTTGPDGKFNVTVRFTVPVDYGGPHSVSATVPWGPGYVPENSIASATFTVTPSIVVAPEIVMDGKPFTIAVYGLKYCEYYDYYCYYYYYYHVVVDNQLMYPWAMCHECGNMTITLIAAGFRPGLHVVSIYEADVVGLISPLVYEVFGVACTGDAMCMNLTAIIGRLLAIHDDVLIIKTDVGSIKAKITALEPVITRIDGNVATLLTRIGAVEAKLDDIKSLIESGNAVLTAINGTVATIRTDVGDIKAKITALEPVITRIDGNVATLVTDVGVIKANLTTIRSLIESGNAALAAIRGDVLIIKTDVGDIKAKITALEPVITRIDGNVATLLTRIGLIETNLTTIRSLIESGNAVLTAINGTVAVIRTDVGDIKAKITALEPVITRIDANVVTLVTDVGVVKTNLTTIRSLIESGNAVLTAINGTVATIRTDVGDIKAKITALEPVITRIDGNVATLLTRIGAVETGIATIRSLVESGNAVLTAINGTVATIRTDVGDIKADVSAIKPTIIAISGDVATVKTDVGTIKADVSAIKPVVTDIKNGVAKVQTALGDLAGVVERIDGNVATVRTDVGTIKADVSDIKGRVPTIQTDVAALKGDVSAVKDATSAVPGLSAAIWVAVVFSIISAALAAFVVITVRRKIAG